MFTGQPTLKNMLVKTAGRMMIERSLHHYSQNNSKWKKKKECLPSKINKTLEVKAQIR